MPSSLFLYLPLSVCTERGLRVVIPGAVALSLSLEHASVRGAQTPQLFRGVLIFLRMESIDIIRRPDLPLAFAYFESSFY